MMENFIRIAEKVVPKSYITLVIVPDEFDFSVTPRTDPRNMSLLSRYGTIWI